MAEFIKTEAAIAIIEEKQKELCPVGRYGRSYVYGSDREKYDAWDEIIDALENIPSADVAPVVHGEWLRADDDWNSLTTIQCSLCSEEWCFETDDDVSLLNYKYCPNCGARMDGGCENA